MSQPARPQHPRRYTRRAVSAKIAALSSSEQPAELQAALRRFGATAALARVDFSVKAGEFVALLGPSGSGKSTQLCVPAEPEALHEGRLIIAGRDGRDMAGVPTRARNVSVVFQNYALFRQMTVLENVPSACARAPPAPLRQRSPSGCATCSPWCQIPELERRYPDPGSGGQCQRVALPCALAIEPALLLLDKPFGALDAQVRKSHPFRSICRTGPRRSLFAPPTCWPNRGPVRPVLVRSVRREASGTTIVAIHLCEQDVVESFVSGRLEALA